MRLLKVLFSTGLIKRCKFFQKSLYESILLISGSSLFHSFIAYGKKSFQKIIFYGVMTERNFYFDQIFVREVKDHRDRKVAWKTRSYIIRGKVSSSNFYLLKILNLILNTISLLTSL